MPKRKYHLFADLFNVIPDCAVPMGERVPFGQPGISPSACEKMGGCVDSFNSACYHPLDGKVLLFRIATFTLKFKIQHHCHWMAPKGPTCLFRTNASNVLRVTMQPMKCLKKYILVHLGVSHQAAI